MGATIVLLMKQWGARLSEDQWLVIIVGLMVPACAAIWLWLRRFDFQVIAFNGAVKFRGRFPPGHRAHVAEFLSSASGKVRVGGRWSRSGRLELKISAATAGERQRIRNYLMATMRPGG